MSVYVFTERSHRVYNNHVKYFRNFCKILRFLVSYIVKGTSKGLKQPERKRT